MLQRLRYFTIWLLAPNMCESSKTLDGTFPIIPPIATNRAQGTFISRYQFGYVNIGHLQIPIGHCALFPKIKRDTPPFYTWSWVYYSWLVLFSLFLVTLLHQACYEIQLYPRYDSITRLQTKSTVTVLLENPEVNVGSIFCNFSWPQPSALYDIHDRALRYHCLQFNLHWLWSTCRKGWVTTVALMSTGDS